MPASIATSSRRSPGTRRLRRSRAAGLLGRDPSLAARSGTRGCRFWCPREQRSPAPADAGGPCRYPPQQGLSRAAVAVLFCAYRDDPDASKERRQCVQPSSEGPARSRSATDPTPSIAEPTDAVVRVVLGCVCGSDLWYYRGDRRTRSARSATSSSASSRTSGREVRGRRQGRPRRSPRSRSATARARTAGAGWPTQLRPRRLVREPRRRRRPGRGGARPVRGRARWFAFPGPGIRTRRCARWSRSPTSCAPATTPR